MKALILVGGFGTRLRPLTFSVPKSVVEFANKPIVAHQIEALAKVGVKEVILAISYQPEMIQKFIPEFEREYGITITCSQEFEPMGTAGPLRLAKEIITKDNQEGIFFVFNSDVICDFPLDKLLKFHKSHGKEGTILLKKVQDPSRFGVVVYDEDTGKINRFVEKPKEFISDKINAGLYIFNTSMIDRIQLRPTSIEREIFPQMASEGHLYSMNLEHFWMDIGQPKDFIIGQSLYLDFLRKKNPELLASGANIVGNVLIDPTAKVSASALLGPDVTIGPNCVIEDGVRVQNSCVLNNVQIKNCSWISGSILGWHSKVGKWTRIEPCTVLGENVVIKDELYINGAYICPHKEVGASVTQNATILM